MKSKDTVSNRSPASGSSVGSSRRSFLKKSVAASVAAPLLASFEEHALVAHAESPAAVPAPGPAASAMPVGKIGKVSISRLICGGNLISGYAHSRDLIYMSTLLKAYFTEEKVMETWAICEQHGVNTMIAYPADPRAVEAYRKYRARGGRMQYLAQVNPAKDDLKTCVKMAVDAGASGAFLLGNIADQWTREDAVGRIGELITLIKDAGLVSGVAGHELRVPMMVEKEKIAPDFYMKTLHNNNYWSKKQPGQTKDVIDNYAVDNYWCVEPEKVIAYMASLKRPWIAYKVLAAGALRPEVGFRYAFENGADFICVGMFDFQVAEDAAATVRIVRETQNRDRSWMA